jgi:two-component system cell cycle response regulator
VFSYRHNTNALTTQGLKTGVSTNNKELSIIIVDDLQFSRIVVKTALKKAGFDGVRMADSANTALRMLDEKSADVVLADWMMPGMDGLEMTELIRQNDEEKGTYTAIILFTANEGVEYLAEAFEHGVDDYIIKPPNPIELAARVNAAARISSMQNDILEISRQMEKTIAHLRQSSLIDPLTGAGNERMLQSELDAHLSEASSRKGGVCLAMIEINELAHIREEHGNETEEELLKSLFRRLRRTVRPTDVVTRLENNVFAIIMHHSKVNNFKMAALDRITNTINQRRFKTKTGNWKATCSIGVHYYQGEMEIISVTEMIKLAEDNLHKARADNTKSIVY